MTYAIEMYYDEATEKAILDLTKISAQNTWSGKLALMITTKAFRSSIWSLQSSMGKKERLILPVEPVQSFFTWRKRALILMVLTCRRQCAMSQGTKHRRWDLI